MEMDSKKEFLQLLEKAIDHAEQMHPDFCQKSTRLKNPKFYAQMAAEYKKANDASAVQVVELVAKEELYEMLEAASAGNYKAAFLEALDLAAVAVRAMDFYAKEEAKTHRRKPRK